jgi:hypothetical protein
LADLIHLLFLVLFIFLLTLAVFGLFLNLAIVELSLFLPLTLLANLRNEEAAESSSFFCYTNSYKKVGILLDSKSCSSN